MEFCIAFLQVRGLDFGIRYTVLNSYSRPVWWRDVVREATYEGAHTAKVQTGLKLGIDLIHCFRSNVFFCFLLGVFSFKLSSWN